MTLQRFEELEAWQEARTLVKELYIAIAQSSIARDYKLAAQAQSAAVSVMSNIAEGFERFNPREFHQFLSIAKASCAEVRSLLYVALDVGYIDEQLFQQLMSQAARVGKLVGALRISVARRIAAQPRKRPTTKSTKPPPPPP